MFIKTTTKKAKSNNRQRSAKNKTLNKGGENGRKGGRKEENPTSNTPFNIAPWKIILGILLVGILGFMYLKHVFATQELLAEVKKLEQKYEQVRRKHDYYRLKYDRITGPKVIYDKAKERGFIDGGPAEKVIEVKPIE